jgi:hypothetical protein
MQTKPAQKKKFVMTQKNPPATQNRRKNTHNPPNPK